MITKAVDGYTVPLLCGSIEDDNVYIVYKRDGKDLGARKRAVPVLTK